MTTTRPPPADGGYPFDSDLHRMTDDGGPAAPDPARWSDLEWRDAGPPAPPVRLYDPPPAPAFPRLHRPRPVCSGRPGGTP